MNQMDKDAIKHIVRAQLYSDEAKRYSSKIRYIFYARKSSCIEKALALIFKNKNSRIKINITGGPDQNGYPSDILIFEFKFHGQIMQISFHDPKCTFSKKLEKVKKIRKYGKTYFLKGSAKLKWNGLLKYSNYCANHICDSFKSFNIDSKIRSIKMKNHYMVF